MSKKRDNHPKSRFKTKNQAETETKFKQQGSEIKLIPNSDQISKLKSIPIIPEEQTNSPDRTVRQYP